MQPENQYELITGCKPLYIIKVMKGIKKLYFMLILFMVSTLQMMAQQKITGRVIDDDGFAVPYASVQYKGHKIGVSSDG